MEEVLGITIVTRDGWFRVDGTPEAIQRAQRTLDQLIHVQRHGVHIGEYEFLQALEHSCLKTSEQSLARIFHTNRHEESAKVDGARRAMNSDDGCVSTHCSRKSSSSTKHPSAFAGSAVDRHEISGLTQIFYIAQVKM
jgi:hypothetical protein